MGYLTSQYFNDLYLYLAQNKLPSKRSAIHKVEAQVEKLIQLDSLLFKLVTTPDRETVLLAIPEVCADKIITLYHSKSFCMTLGSDKNIPYSRRQVFYPRSYALFKTIHERVQHLPTSQKRQATNKAIANQNLIEL